MTVPVRQLRIEPSAFDAPVAAALVRCTEDELCLRYGVPTIGVLDPAVFGSAAGGRFVVARLADQPVGCGGYRRLAPGVCELKRLFVAAPARRRGVARALLSHLERAAHADGYRQLWLETGTEQPEALALYATGGYRSVAPFELDRPAPFTGGEGRGPAPDGWPEPCVVVHDSRSVFLGIELATAVGVTAAPAGGGSAVG